MEETYIKLYDWMLQNENLAGAREKVYALIYQMTKRKADDGWWGGYDMMAKRLRLTRRSCIKAVLELEGLGAVKRVQIDGKMHILAQKQWAIEAKKAAMTKK